LNTFGIGLSFHKAPFISSIALFGVTATLTDIIIRCGRPGGFSGLIGISLLAFSMLMLSRLGQVLRFFITSTNEMMKYRSWRPSRRDCGLSETTKTVNGPEAGQTKTVSPTILSLNSLMEVN
jgi:hypothetical protein